MKHFTLDHCSGAQTVDAARKVEIVAAISAVSHKIAPKAASAIRAQLIRELKTRGWSDEVSVSANSDITITSAKGNIGLCLQTGNMSRIYADLVKLQAMYLDNMIKGAVIIVPSQDAAKILGSNIAQAKRLERELQIFKKAYHVPTIIFALES